MMQIPSAPAWLIRLVPVCVLIGTVGLSAPARAECRSSVALLQKTLQAKDLAGAERQAEGIAGSILCEPAEIRAAQRALADALVVAAKRLGTDPRQADAAAELLQKAGALKASWNAMREFGDWQAAHKQFAEAANSYQIAINLIADYESAEETTSLAATIQRLVRRAAEARHLAAQGEAGQFVGALPNRAGEMGGVYSGIVTDRGPVGYPSPICFVFDSDEFTPVGQEAAEEFAELVQERQPRSIIVVGHTDHAGSDDYNLKLSLKRAEKVKAFLNAHHFQGSIRVIGKGRSEPRILSDPASYTPSEIDELNRRVEFSFE